MGLHSPAMVDSTFIPWADPSLSTEVSLTKFRVPSKRPFSIMGTPTPSKVTNVSQISNKVKMRSTLILLILVFK